MAAQCQPILDDLEDFLFCPFQPIDFTLRVERLLPNPALSLSLDTFNSIETALYRNHLIGESDPFMRILHQVVSFAHTDATVLITGETGTGKELIACAIHYHSSRRDNPFVPVNCGALPDHLVENELFGHIQGAFTDANAPEHGLVAEAEAGTLFLDEVDTLSAAAQVKVLRFLQNREYRPLGSAKSMTANVRIVAATNANLQPRVRERLFREDLYYSLHILSLCLPPLRERRDDIPLLARHFLRQYGQQYARWPLRLSIDALQKLLSYDWPGNIREFETVMQRTASLAASSLLHANDIDLPISYQSPPSTGPSFQQAKAQAIEEFERIYLVNLLTAHNGNVTHAARQAGKERRAFQRLLRKYDLDHVAFRA